MKTKPIRPSATTALSMSPFSARCCRASVAITLSALLIGVASVVCAQDSAQTGLMELRVGPHKSFDRVVFEFPTEVPRQVIRLSAQQYEVHFQNARISESFVLPRMPRGLTVLSAVQVRNTSGSEVVFDIRLSRDATTTELPLAGYTWRLAIDFAPRVTEQPAEKPEYIPGDRPIPTTFAEADTAATTSDTSDPAQIHSVLAYFFLARGDTENAQREAQIYRDLSGSDIALMAAPAPEKPQPLPQQITLPIRNAASTTFLNLPITAVIGLIFGVGLLLGLGLTRTISARKSAVQLPRVKFRLPKRTKRPKKDLPVELSEDIETLEKAVEQEPARPVAAQPPKSAPPTAPKPAPAPEPEPIPAPVVDAEKEAKDSLMDRRVRRVLELNTDGKSIGEIAEDLQMGQDEVRLILDLNR